MRARQAGRSSSLAANRCAHVNRRETGRPDDVAPGVAVSSVAGSSAESSRANRSSPEESHRERREREEACCTSGGVSASGRSRRDLGVSLRDVEFADGDDERRRRGDGLADAILRDGRMCRPVISTHTPGRRYVACRPIVSFTRKVRESSSRQSEKER